MATIQGAYITVLGMATLFVALLILMLAAMGLERLFRPKQPVEQPTPEGKKALVAAIATAIALELKRKTPDAKRKKTPEQGLNAWRSWGRYKQLTRSKELKRHRR
jgi:Na+-transporting methylmalonyl-CoA/oxaloacetate decarboxylase gamma subunit